jgi:GNAT superfamily N-acetyltransferase
MPEEPHHWRLTTSVDADLEDVLTGRLVEFNTSRSAAVRERFAPGNLASVPLHAFALDEQADLVGGCAARVEEVWHWVTIDTMWVREACRGRGVGLALLRSVEDQARRLGCRWSDVTTFDFQAPDFYRRAGYEEYGAKRDYPPGHTNHYLRRTL